MADVENENWVVGQLLCLVGSWDFQRLIGKSAIGWAVFSCLASFFFVAVH